MREGQGGRVTGPPHNKTKTKTNPRQSQAIWTRMAVVHPTLLHTVGVKKRKIHFPSSLFPACVCILPTIKQKQKQIHVNLKPYCMDTHGSGSSHSAPYGWSEKEKVTVSRLPWLVFIYVSCQTNPKHLIDIVVPQRSKIGLHDLDEL